MGLGRPTSVPRPSEFGPPYEASQAALVVKNLPASAGDMRHGFGEIPLEKETATHSSILAWRIPWTEDPGGWQRVGQD